jgi:hypothetical protein
MAICLTMTNIFIINIRGDDGELRLGIRRAVQLKSSGTFAAPSGMQLDPGSLMDVVNALSKRSAFSVCYNPRYFSSCLCFPPQMVKLICESVSFYVQLWEFHICFLPSCVIYVLC